MKTKCEIVMKSMGILVFLHGGMAAGLPETGNEEAVALIAGDLRRSGTIELEVSCRPEVRKDFETSVALLHSFFYDEARRRFLDVAMRDPECAMAWWGVAMTWYHPLWAPPNAVERAKGLAAVEKAQAIGGKSALERGLIDAIATFYLTTEIPVPEEKSTVVAGCNCCGPQAHGARAIAFHAKLEKLHQQFPEHTEVAAFHALAILGTADPKDKTLSRQRRAGALLEALFEKNPDHPGVAHYLIHSYDYPELAEQGLGAARAYDEIAPWVPHALHMPSHIYTRLGMWGDSIMGNIASSGATREYAARYYEGGTTSDDLHAMDYLMFAYLQTGQDKQASQVLAEIGAVEKIVPGSEFASAYALGAIPARYALERRDWKGAATLTVPLPEFLSRFPMAMAHIEFAHAVGAARSGDDERAADAVRRLTELRDELKESPFSWWTDQVEIQRLSASAWLAHSRGQTAEAERLFRKAATVEDLAGTHPVTPGQILPVREQLGDFLLEKERPQEALREFEQSLVAFPRRFRSHEGVMRAAMLIGKEDLARKHATSLLLMAGESGERVEVLGVVRSFSPSFSEP